MQAKEDLLMRGARLRVTLITDAPPLCHDLLKVSLCRCQHGFILLGGLAARHVMGIIRRMSRRRSWQSCRTLQ